MIVHISFFLQVRDFYSASAAQMFCKICSQMFCKIAPQKKIIQVKTYIRVSK